MGSRAPKNAFHPPVGASPRLPPEPAKRRRGRPKKDGTRIHTGIVLEENLLAGLDAWAGAHGLDRSEAITAAVEALLKW